MPRTDLLRQAASFMPAESREEALQIAFLSAAGYGPVAIGSQLGMTWRRVNDLRDELADGVVQTFAANGYTEAETIRTLGIPTAAVHERNFRWSGNGRITPDFHDR